MPDPSARHWLTLTSDILLDAMPFLRVRRDRCQLPDGRIVSDYYVVEEHDVVLILALTGDQEVLLVEQYKHGAGAIMIELPAGMMEGDDPLTDAMRELREETGYGGGEWQRFLTLRHSPTRSSHRVYIFLARGVEWQGNQELDENEHIQVHRVSLATARQWLDEGRFEVADTVAALAYFFANQPAS